MIGENIKYFRKLKGLSQHELARMIGHKSAAYISFLEDGRRRVNAEDLGKIAEVLCAPVEEFYKNKPMVDMKMVELKSGQIVKIAGIPCQVQGGTKVLIHRNNYPLIEKELISKV